MGTLIVQSFPELEKQGTNLVLECCYLAIRKCLEDYGVDHIDTFYFQLDNTSVNKAWTLMAGLGALTLAGVVRKIKVSYLLVGHTHEDVDAIIGKVLGAMRKFDMFTFRAYEEQADASLLKLKCRILGIQRIIGIPDYDIIFRDFNRSSIQGLSDIQQMRILAEPDGSRLSIHYRTDCTVPAWLPSPFPQSIMFSNLWPFRHELSPQQPPFRVTRTPLTGEQGRRTWWLYQADYAGPGERRTRHEYASPSLPTNLSRSMLREKLMDLKRQPFKAKFFSNIAVVSENVYKVLRRRRRPRADFQEWGIFFAALPTCENDPRYSDLNSSLVFLLGNYSRKIINVRTEL